MTKPEARQPQGGELLPCPFCGEQPVYLTDFENDSGVETVHHISCGLCSIQPGIYGEKSKEQAMRKWNTRIATGQQLCAKHQTQFTSFEVGGCLVCWRDDTRATADKQALRKVAARVIDTVLKSPVVVETRCFSQPDEVDRLEGVVAALITGAPRATGETTVEACLAELREMFPSWHCEIRKAQYLGEKSRRVYTRFDVYVTDFRKNDWTEYGPTLDAVMAQVRAAPRPHGRGEVE